MIPLRTRSAVLIAVLAFAVAPASSALANLISNGSFETGPTLPAFGSMLIAAGETGLTGWTIGGLNLEYVNDAVWVPADGTRSLALSGTGPGALSQAFATVPGSLYTVTFSLSGEAHVLPDIKNVRVAAAGQQQDFSFNSSEAWEWDMKWVTRTWSFTANATTSTLSFTSLDPGDASVVLDKVDVATNVGVGDDLAPLALAPVTPNPVAGPATIAFALPRATDVRLVVCDLQGRVVANLIDGVRPAGQNRVRWDVRTGNDLPSGLYFVSLTAEGRTLVRRVSLVRGR